MAHDAEVVVVGGGLGGSAVALGLARGGHEVILLERKRAGVQRNNVCGEGLMPHGLSALVALGVSPPAGAKPFLGIRWRSRSAVAVGRFAEGKNGLGVRRLDLDPAVASAAAEHPHVLQRMGVSVTGLTMAADGVHVLTTEGPIRAKVVVGADGRQSIVRRSAGLSRVARGRLRYGVRAHGAWSGEMPDLVEVVLGDGYELYLTPVGDGLVNVAGLCERSAARQLKGDGVGVLSRWLSSAPFGDRVALFDGAKVDFAATGPLRHEATAAAAERVVLVGDAAGFLDGITGEGMSTALQSAALAVAALSTGLGTGRFDASALAAYARAHRRLVRDRNWLTEAVLWGIRHPWLAERVVRRLARHPALFDRVLAVETGEAPMCDLGLAGLRSLVVP